MRRLWDLLFKRRGAPYWRVFIWATAFTALAAMPIVTAFPSTVPLVWLWLVGIPANSPVAPLFPTAFEPLVVEAAKYEPALTVTLVATASFVYMEFINWYVFAWVLSWDKLEALKSHRWVRWGLRHFSHAPYLTVFAFAATPIPFWIARSLAILHRLSFWRYMVAMAIGRFPRLYIYAWLGSRIRIPTAVLVGTAVGTGVILIAWRLLRKEPLLKNSVLDG